MGSGGATSTATNPAYTYTANGTYTVTLIASNGTCLDTATAIIVVDVATSIVIPNIFSPNGDGVNETFMIMCTGMKSLTCDIYNRWGQLVYTLNGPNEVWDGKLNNGNQATEGTYYFMLNAVGLDGKTYSYQGPLTLVK
jgi:gliding motility-associated-like protein